MQGSAKSYQVGFIKGTIICYKFMEILFKMHHVEIPNLVSTACLTTALVTFDDFADWSLNFHHSRGALQEF